MMGGPETIRPWTNIFRDPWYLCRIKCPMDTISPGNFVLNISKPRTYYLVWKPLGINFQGHVIQGTFDFKDYGSQTICSGTVRSGTSHHNIVNFSKNTTQQFIWTSKEQNVFTFLTHNVNMCTLCKLWILKIKEISAIIGRKSTKIRKTKNLFLFMLIGWHGEKNLLNKPTRQRFKNAFS